MVIDRFICEISQIALFACFPFIPKTVMCLPEPGIFFAVLFYFIFYFIFKEEFFNLWSLLPTFESFFNVPSFYKLQLFSRFFSLFLI